jgi:hypothetical protein
MTPVPVQAFLTEVRSAFDARLNSVGFAYDTKAGDFESLVMDGQLDEAEALLASRPAEREDAGSWNLLAGIASVRGDLGGAARYTLAAITADPENAEAWYAHAALLLRNDQTEDASTQLSVLASCSLAMAGVGVCSHGAVMGGVTRRVLPRRSAARYPSEPILTNPRRFSPTRRSTTGCSPRSSSQP